MQPDEFIPIAELTTMIEDIDSWVIEQTKNDLQRLEKMTALSHLKVAINISSRHLCSKNFSTKIENLFSNTPNLQKKYIFEITETSILSDIPKASSALESLCSLGIEIALDDFGTGYTSMLHLKKLPISYLKIDKEFIRDLFDDESDKAIVKAIISLSKSLGIKSVAEGVEEEKQLKFIEKYNCDFFQGYLYGKPMSIEKLIAKFCIRGD